MSDLADPIEAYGCAAVIASAVEVGLVESLSDPAPAVEHASRLGLDPEATRLELEALVASASPRNATDASVPPKLPTNSPLDCLAVQGRSAVYGPTSRTSSEQGNATRRWMAPQRNDRPPTRN